jgi:hypothetical protein
MAAIQSYSEVVVKPIRPLGAGAALVVIFLAIVPNMCAQEATPPQHTGVPQDWSQHHIVFSRDALAQNPDLIDREPRILNQAMQRWQVPNFGVFQGADPLPASVNEPAKDRDWNVNLAGRVPIDTFPAKFSYDPSAPPDCTNDYVVFGLASPETAGTPGVNANFVGFNDLYSTQPTAGGLCDTDGPSVLFAYNITTVTTGRIVTSPVLSENGKQIAFVESIPGPPAEAIFHVLTWTAGQGSIHAAALPTMTSVVLSSTANDTTSSPWIDYGTDTAYVATDDGVVYQITGVFTTTPTLSTSPWPIKLTTTSLSSPVLDANLGLLMVGGHDNGTLYQININSPSTAPVTLQVGYNRAGKVTPGIVAPPVVDITNGTTFVVSAYGDFTFGINNTFAAVLVQADTATLGKTVLQVANIGEGSTTGTHLSLYEPAFSNNYYSAPSSGVISLCGTGASNTNPYQYAFGFTGIKMNASTPVISQELSTVATDTCTGWTEFYNPNINSGVDFFFFGLTGDCTLLPGGTGVTTGCVVALSSDSTIPTTTASVRGGPSGIVVDNYSTASQASSIYFTAVGRQTAYKFTQDGLH